MNPQATFLQNLGPSTADRKATVILVSLPAFYFSLTCFILLIYLGIDALYKL